MAMSKTEKMSHFAVVFIAICAVVVSVWQVQLSQRHNRLTVRPYFNFSTGTVTTATKHEFQLSVTNGGYGPAIIKDFQISVDGQEVRHWNAAVDQLADSVLMTGAANFGSGDVFPPGKEEILLTLERYVSENRIKLRIVYESIYNEQFDKEVEF